MKTVSLLCGTLTALVAGGCASRQQDDDLEPASRNVTFVVENRTTADATVYAVWYSHRQRLGRVTALSSDTFETRWVAPTVRAEIHLLAGGTHAGDAISVQPGDTVHVSVPSVLGRAPGTAPLRQAPPAGD